MVLQAVLNKLLPGDHRYFPLQPEQPVFGEKGTGWNGVRRWCRATWQQPDSGLDLILSGKAGPALDLLVIHVDAGIAFEDKLQKDEDTPIPDVPQPCPPVQATVDQLRRVIGRWLRCDSLPPQVVLAIPAQDTESWTFAALFPDDELCQQDDYECIRSGRRRPGYRLTLKKYGRLFRRKDNKPKKTERAYRQVAPRVAEAWDAVRCTCTQAEQFTRDVFASISSNQEPNP
jgi:hypothetical protein